MLNARTVACPYCGESFETTIDVSAGEQEYIEDCQVCCRPIVFRIQLDAAGGVARVEARRDDD
jgi:hypothetical protein